MAFRTISFRVSGRVQGVGFRYATRNQASMLGLTGWVRNCANGEVEGVAQGDELPLNQFVDWLWQGPDHAKVAGVLREDQESEKIEGFSIVR